MIFKYETPFDEISAITCRLEFYAHKVLDNLEIKYISIVWFFVGFFG